MSSSSGFPYDVTTKRREITRNGANPEREMVISFTPKNGKIYSNTTGYEHRMKLEIVPNPDYVSKPSNKVNVSAQTPTNFLMPPKRIRQTPPSSFSTSPSRRPISFITKSHTPEFTPDQYQKNKRPAFVSRNNLRHIPNAHFCSESDLTSEVIIEDSTECFDEASLLAEINYTLSTIDTTPISVKYNAKNSEKQIVEKRSQMPRPKQRRITLDISPAIKHEAIKRRKSHGRDQEKKDDALFVDSSQVMPLQQFIDEEIVTESPKDTIITPKRSQKRQKVPSPLKVDFISSINIDSVSTNYEHVSERETEDEYSEYSEYSQSGSHSFYEFGLSYEQSHQNNEYSVQELSPKSKHRKHRSHKHHHHSTDIKSFHIKEQSNQTPTKRRKHSYVASEIQHHENELSLSDIPRIQSSSSTKKAPQSVKNVKDTKHIMFSDEFNSSLDEEPTHEKTPKENKQIIHSVVLDIPSPTHETKDQLGSPSIDVEEPKPSPDDQIVLSEDESPKEELPSPIAQKKIEKPEEISLSEPEHAANEQEQLNDETHGQKSDDSIKKDEIGKITSDGEEEELLPQEADNSPNKEKDSEEEEFHEDGFSGSKEKQIHDEEESKKENLVISEETNKDEHVEHVKSHDTHTEINNNETNVNSVHDPTDSDLELYEEEEEEEDIEQLNENPEVKPNNQVIDSESKQEETVKTNDNIVQEQEVEEIKQDKLEQNIEEQEPAKEETEPTKDELEPTKEETESIQEEPKLAQDENSNSHSNLIGGFFSTASKALVPPDDIPSDIDDEELPVPLSPPSKSSKNHQSSDLDFELELSESGSLEKKQPKSDVKPNTIDNLEDHSFSGSDIPISPIRKASNASRASSNKQILDISDDEILYSADDQAKFKPENEDNDYSDLDLRYSD